MMLGVYTMINISFAQDNTNLDQSGNAGYGGTHNTMIGYYSGDYVSGTQNTFTGASIGLVGPPSGNYNTLLGAYAGYCIKDGNTNSFMGRYSGFSCASGGANSFLGELSGQNTISSDNSFLGTASGYYNYSGTMNCFIGYRSGFNNQTGNNNTYIGYQTGYYGTTGSSSVFIGYNAGLNEYDSDKLYIDNTSSDTPLIYGDFLTAALTVNGTNTVTGNTTINGNLSGKSGNFTYSNLYKFGGLYLRWDSDESGIDAFHSIRSTYGDTEGDDITINSYNKLRVNLDVNNNNSSSTFEIGHGTTGTSGALFSLENATGNVGIGISPQADSKLSVNGHIKAHELEINLQNWADNVFDHDYELCSITELEEYIEENNHLPEVPSEEEIIDTGIPVNEINVILLKKVEELTLYLIEQEELIRHLEDEIMGIIEQDN